MTKTIGEVALQMGISTATIRYYDEQGLLPFVQRDAGGRRVFGEDAIQLLETIQSLKITGMSIADMKTYVEWIIAGDATMPDRLAFLAQHRRKVLSQIAAQQASLAKVETKMVTYRRRMHIQEDNEHE